ncbi:hypothetical protein HDV05_004572 [Chytridiales sp. JEL 0842]|nr:hypothetical protein HDV05_004572 [Chytridiales sp. JEL 0842]
MDGKEQEAEKAKIDGRAHFAYFVRRMFMIVRDPGVSAMEEDDGMGNVVPVMAPTTNEPPPETVGIPINKTSATDSSPIPSSAESTLERKIDYERPETFFEVSPFELDPADTTLATWTATISPLIPNLCAGSHSRTDNPPDECYLNPWFEVIARSSQTLLAGRVRREGVDEIREAQKGDASRVVVYLEYAWFFSGVLQDFHDRKVGIDFFEKGSNDANTMPSAKPLHLPLMYGGQQTIKADKLRQIIKCDTKPPSFEIENIRGYWNLTTYPPHFRGLCGNSLFNPNDKLDITPLRDKWIMFIGDSNTRMTFDALSDSLKGPVYPLSPYKEDLKAKMARPQDFKGYYTREGVLISNFFFFPMWWKKELPEMQVNASRFFVDKYRNKSSPLALSNLSISPTLENKLEPDYIVLSVGSHNPENPRGAVQAVDQLLKIAGFSPKRDPNAGDCSDNRFLFVSTIATDAYGFSLAPNLVDKIGKSSKGRLELVELWMGMD